MLAKTSMEIIKSLLFELKYTLVLAGVPEEQVRVRNTKHSTAACARAFDWLHDIKISNELAHWQDIRGLLPEATWEKYILFSFEGLREQELLIKASKALKARWRKKRPAMFNANVQRKRNAEST